MQAQRRRFHFDPQAARGRRLSRAFVGLSPRRWFAVAVAGLVLSATAGCSDSCAELEARICARAGAGSAVCESMQQVVASPRAGDEQACSAGAAFLDELKRGR